MPQDRDGTFEPKVVKKRQKDISGIEQKIISLYAKGMTTRQISETIEDIYSFEVSDGMVSDITDRLLPQIEDWQKRPLDEVYPIVFIDAVHFSVRNNGQIQTTEPQRKGKIEQPSISQNTPNNYSKALQNGPRYKGQTDITDKNIETDNEDEY